MAVGIAAYLSACFFHNKALKHFILICQALCFQIVEFYGPACENHHVFFREAHIIRHSIHAAEFLKGSILTVDLVYGSCKGKAVKLTVSPEPKLIQIVLFICVGNVMPCAVRIHISIFGMVSLFLFLRIRSARIDNRRCSIGCQRKVWNVSLLGWQIC